MFSKISRVLETRKILFLILLVSLFLRVFILIHDPMPLTKDKLLNMYPDENVYSSIADIFQSGGWYKGFVDNMSIWAAPLNPLYLSVLYGVTDEPILFARLFNIIVSVLTVFLVFWLGRAYYSHRVGAVAALLIGIYYPIVELAPTLLTEPLYMFLLLCAALCLVKAHKQTGYKYFILCAICLGLGSLTRSSLMLAPFFLLIMSIIFNFRNREVLRKYLVMCLVATFVMSPIVIKNYILFNKATISTGSGAVLFLGSRADTEGDEPPYRGKDYDTMQITTPYNHLQPEGDARLMKVAIENIKSNLFPYMYWNIKKIGRLLVGNEFYWFFPYDNVFSYSNDHSVLNVLVKLFNLFLTLLIVIFGSAIMLIRFIKTKLRDPLILLFFYHLLVSLPFLATHRYGLPLLCILSVFAGASLFRKEVSMT